MSNMPEPLVGLIWYSDTDPTASPGVSAPLYQLCIYTGDESLYWKSGAAATAWTKITGGGGGQIGVNLEQDGAPITGSPFSTLNLIGAIVADAGGGVADIDILDDSELLLLNNTGSTVPPGTPVYISASATFQLANATAILTGRTIGVAKDEILADESGPILTAGLITLTTAQWDAICGTIGGLAYDVPYYLSASTPGTLTSVPPNVAGQIVQQVIVGISTTQAVVKISDPVIVGSGSSVIYLTNDNAGTILICQPVYSSSADGCDLAFGNNTGKGRVIGLVADVSIAHATRGRIVVEGLMVASTAQWDTVCGTVGGLTFNTTYYLSIGVAGNLTSVAPTSPTDDGKQVVIVINALSATEARISIQPPILL